MEINSFYELQCKIYDYAKIMACSVTSFTMTENELTIRLATKHRGYKQDGTISLNLRHYYKTEKYKMAYEDFQYELKRFLDSTNCYYSSYFPNNNSLSQSANELYANTIKAMRSYGGIPADDYNAWPAKNPYKEILYKPARNGGKRAMYTYSDILWVEKIEKVIFNDPATIVFWRDGSKTVVKAQTDETFDPEKGLAMAISKKALGNEGNYYETFKKFLPKE